MVDVITLEVVRCKLEAILDDGTKAMQRTGISPILVAGDCSCTIYDAAGALIIGGGHVLGHAYTGANGVRAINELHGQTVADGDIFLVNDPYNGGGFHAQDVFFHLPVFADGVLVAWIGASGHMMDMGGALLGSFVPDATECYAEALRFPPVRVYRQGEEQRDVWAILRNNVRLSTLVEMDMRALISGATLVRNQLADVIKEYGQSFFTEAMKELCDLTEAEIRRRVARIEPGVYKAQTWCEWADNVFSIPCTLTISVQGIVFDFRDASPQSNHYFNSRAYVVKSLIGILLADYFGADLPINEGLFRTFMIKTREGSILDAQPPAPIAGPHLYAGEMAVEVAAYALNLALAASPESPARRNMAGPSAHSGQPLHTVACTGIRGQPDGWLLLDSTLTGASAGFDRDATDMAWSAVGKGSGSRSADIEVLESWYPILIERRERRVMGDGGAGTFRAGAGISMSYRLAGTSEASIATLGNRERTPITGHAGGLPGSTTRFAIRSDDGSERNVACNQQDVLLRDAESFIFEALNGGGWGDPLEREPSSVEADARHRRLSSEEARAVYGVVVGDPAQTTQTRATMLCERLARAEPAKRPLSWSTALRKQASGIVAPLYIGVEQRGAVAVSTRSEAPLAVSPDSWADGCPIIRSALRRPSLKGEFVAYLDPVTGHFLMVDVVVDTERTFDSAPDRWRFCLER